METKIITHFLKPHVDQLEIECSYQYKPLKAMKQNIGLCTGDTPPNTSGSL